METATSRMKTVAACTEAEEVHTGTASARIEDATAYIEAVAARAEGESSHVEGTLYRA